MVCVRKSPPSPASSVVSGELPEEGEAQQEAAEGSQTTAAAAAAVTARAVFERMRARGVAPNLTTFGTLLDAYVMKLKYFARSPSGWGAPGMGLVNRIVMSTSPLLSSSSLHHRVFNRHAERGDVEGAMRVFFEEMVKEARLRPNEVVFGTLMKVGGRGFGA